MMSFAVSFFSGLVLLQSKNLRLLPVSPRNYFLFTPMLPSATVGTVETRSIVVPIREVVSHKAMSTMRRLFDMYAGKRGPPVTFVEASCTHIDHERKVVYCEDISDISLETAFEVSYDKLVLAVRHIAIHRPPAHP